ncbi:hypothetical protein jhhlp_003390 [Lomentospora prolificans]|uniref:Signal recognition particle subunit SRP68 n=1 Tax=Lomentospora prolificans TaxID=41688 RepID=A0A2N3N8L0_9PEZI|nr:hypothetical protein jhhlp_003390 [Lomentospora prolificans]
MDITKLVVSGRSQAFGDNAVYRAQLSRRLLKSRKKLGIATKNRGKYQKKDEVTAEQIKENPEYVHLLLLASERAWAHAMSMRSAHMTDAKGIAGRTRSHIISRIEKAAQTAEQLVSALSDAEESGAKSTDVLEAFAYAGMMRGAANFEKQSWEKCLKNYSVSYAIYSALKTSSADSETYRDLLSEIIEPSIQFAAYQLKTPRTVPIHIIARKAFPTNNSFLVDEINERDPSVLRQGDAESKKEAGAEDVPKTLTWRSREVRIEDAAIALAWKATLAAKDALASKIASTEAIIPKELATAYDDILAATQDAVDAAKQALDELRGESVPQTDPRMQSLQITRTAVNYEMISWRIGRNRVLTGAHDGALEDYSELSKRELKRRAKAKEDSKPRDVKLSRKLNKLKERVALYDGALQNLEEAKALPGVPADEELTHRLMATAKYFTALKALSIARSHALTGNNPNALALLAHAHSLVQSATPVLSSSPPPPTRKTSKSRPPSRVLLAQGVKLENIVEWPPKIGLVPAKPIFLDVAWNYIDYPDKRVVEPGKNKEEKNQKQEEARVSSAPQKRGWFGFGRS